MQEDGEGRFFIKGRNSNMILGPSGENIYPEEIENVLNNVEGVSESIVVERGGRLVALVQPMENYIEWDKDSEVMKEPFEKTATQKIRRFRYKESAPTIEESMK